jgi:hypothetical protein
VLNTPQHPSVKNWCADLLNIINSQLETEEESKLESEERINDDYLDVRMGKSLEILCRFCAASYHEHVQLQDQIISGSLPCPKEEAALLAAVQLCVEENWPNNRRTQTIRRHLLKGQFGRIRDLAQKIMVTPWEVGKCHQRKCQRKHLAFSFPKVDQTLYCTPPRALSDSAASNRKVSTNPHHGRGAMDPQEQSRRRRSLTLFR